MVSVTPDDTNEMFSLATKLVSESNRSIFLTGRAGTGKTTFLHYIRKNIAKQMAVLAPTGVAAINAGGVTIHSFFQLPIAPFVPESRLFEENISSAEDKHSLLSRLRLTTERKKLIQQLELLVIDEVSMVRCDTLDAIDTVLRHVRHRPQEVFGGVQLLFIGDLFQLPPVAQHAEWNILSQFYSSPYFFDSRALKEQPPLYIEFTKIYRQSDARFILALNQVRNNKLTEEGMEILDSRVDPNFQRAKDSGYIVLTTHNSKADDINNIELGKLPASAQVFKAAIDGDFPDKAFPAEESLQLKIGAQVMFIKNDPDKGRRYYNGKIGTVASIEKDKIIVETEDATMIEVTRHEWKNIRYSLNASSRKVEEEDLGTFKQYPLRLAWAITIHKSQGLTFEKAIIDTGSAFAPGQVYVALSRCTSLEGLVLKTKVRSHGLFTDNRVVEFAQTAANTDQLRQELDSSTNKYKVELLASVFDFNQVLADSDLVNEYVEKNNTHFNVDAQKEIAAFREQLSQLQAIGRKFIIQVKPLLLDGAASPAFIQERISAAVNYFDPHIGKLRKQVLAFTLSTEHKLHAKEVNDRLKEVFRILSLQQHLLTSSHPAFTIEAYHIARNSFVQPSFTINVYRSAPGDSSSVANPTLYYQLKKLRDAICEEKGLPIYYVANSKSLEELAKYLPQTKEELVRIGGFGEAKVAAYGQQFLDVITEYCASADLPSQMSEHPSYVTKKKKEKASKIKSASPSLESSPSIKKSKRTTTTSPGGVADAAKKDTKTISYDLFSTGKTVVEIARERNLSPQTIENHLAHFIETGLLNVVQLVNEQKLVRINKVLEHYAGGPITPVREQLGDDISFGEIRFAFAQKRFNERANA